MAELPPADGEALLLTADRFGSEQPGLGLTELERERLLARLGLFGVRLAVSLLQQDPQLSATALARSLTAHSGLDGLRELLRTLFLERRDVLKARSALLAVEALVRERPVPGCETLAAAVEEVIASAHPFNELRVLSSLRAGWVTGKPTVLAELERVIGGDGGAAHVRLGLGEDAGPTEQAAAAQEALLRWQRRAANPLTGRQLAVASQVAVRSCEGVLAEVRGAS